MYVKKLLATLSPTDPPTMLLQCRRKGRHDGLSLRSAQVECAQNSDHAQEGKQPRAIASIILIAKLSNLAILGNAL